LPVITACLAIPMGVKGNPGLAVGCQVLAILGCIESFAGMCYTASVANIITVYLYGDQLAESSVYAMIIVMALCMSKFHLADNIGIVLLDMLP